MPSGRKSVRKIRTFLYLWAQRINKPASAGQMIRLSMSEGDEVTVVVAATKSNVATGGA